MRKKPLLLISGFILMFLLVAADLIDDPIDKILGTLKKYVEEYPQEKVYVHFDKPYYAAGETAWFKTYLLAGSYHQASPLSYTIKVELLNPEKEIIGEVNLKSEKGLAHSSFVLPDSLQSGNYIVRAYTPWMRNFDNTYFFKKEIRVLGLQKKSHPATESINIQFFPEGGTLLNGLKNKVAFKAVGPDGFGKKVSIKISDNNNAVVVQAESNQLGMGFFQLTPEAGKKYRAGLINSQVMFDLPASQNTGFIMVVTNKPDQSEVTVRLQTNTATQNKQQVILLAQCRGVVSFMAKADLSNNLFFAKIPKNRLLSGITQLTLFDALGLPVAERLIFHSQDDRLKIAVTPGKPVYKPREKVELDIKVTSYDDKAVEGNFSMAVLDDEQIMLNPDQNNIVSYLWLSSDLRGHIENAGYYFNPENTDRHEALDVLLLTQGWRRFVWTDALADRWPEIQYAIDRGLEVRGKLMDALTKKPVAGGKVTFLSSDKNADIIVTETGNDGSFKLDNLIFYDSADVILQGENKRGSKNVTFEISAVQNPEANAIASPAVSEMEQFERNYFAAFLERKRINASYAPDGESIELKAVEISGDRIEATAVEKMYGKGSRSLKVSELPGYQSAVHPLQLIQGRIAGVQVTGSGFGYSVVIRGAGTLTGNTTPLIMIDNVPVDISVLNTLLTQDVESIEVYKGSDAAVFGSQGANGAILFYTKKGGGYTSARQGVFNLRFGGYNMAKEFYAPKYDVSRPEHEKPDKRATIFWAPLIQTDAEGKAKVSFYNSDNETTVTGVIEGISGAGLPGTSVFRYEIIK